MKIEDKRIDNKVRLCDLDVGDIFKYSNEIYINSYQKIQEQEGYKAINCVNVKTGEPCSISDNTYVEALNSNLVIE